MSGGPAVADAEGERGGVCGVEEFLEFGLLEFFKDRDGAEIFAERGEIPAGGIEGGDGDAGVVLGDGGGVGEEELASGGEGIEVEEERGRFEEGIGVWEGGGELEVAAFGDAGVGEIGGEVVEGLWGLIWGREDDFDAWGGVFGGGVGWGAVGGEVSEGRGADDFSRASEEDIEDGDGAIELVTMEFGLHVFGFEEAEAEEGVEGFLEALEGGGEFGEFGGIWEVSDGFEAAEDGGGGFGEEGVGVEVIWAAEEVDAGGVWGGEMGGAPGVEFGELAFFEGVPGGIEEVGVFLPGGLLGEFGERGIGGRGEPGEEAGDVVLGGGGNGVEGGGGGIGGGGGGDKSGIGGEEESGGEEGEEQGGDFHKGSEEFLGVNS